MIDGSGQRCPSPNGWDAREVPGFAGPIVNLDRGASGQIRTAAISPQFPAP